MKTDVAVIGGGPAGLAAALAAAEYADVTIIERDSELGGILQQCIHNGFGNFIFKKMMTGPEYAHHFIDKVRKAGIDVMLNSSVIEIEGKSKKIVVASPSVMEEIGAKAIVLAMGCRERSRAQILIPGTRPAGVYTAGTAQRLINIDGVMPGSRVVILGSGDVGLIMARRLTLEGAEVEGVYEIMPEPGGLTRNIAQCLDDYGIPLHLSHTVTDIKGKERVEGVTVSKVDGNMHPIGGTERFVPCDTLILAVGLIPENELSKQAGIAMDGRTGGAYVDEHMETSVPGIFACGNVVHVHDLVDDVTVASEIAGEYAGRYAMRQGNETRQGLSGGRERTEVVAGDNVRYVVPQFFSGSDARFADSGRENITFYFRVKKEARNVTVIMSAGGKSIFERKEAVVKPPEMVKMDVPSSLLEGAKGLRVDVKEEEDG
ncbi:MAG: FAD-dependent oxidoreductase [Nitrospiraceae bacterium]|nr:FAD-dependent oxidoreductase [Nitrospiraceae bacterium]